jgi:phosphoribosylformylglycinamidine synthase
MKKKKTHQRPRAPARILARAHAQKKALPAPSRKPRCLVLSGFGLNSELELAHAFSLGGAEPHIVHFSDISSGEEKLSDYEIFAIPGGWSFGDDIASGKVLANKLKSTFRSQFEQFASSGKPVIGICNGFQVLVKLGALPNLSSSFSQEATLAGNASGKFEDRWVYLKPQKGVCRYFEGVEFINCPVRHGEGRFIAQDQSLLSALERKGQVALKYVDEKMGEAEYPANPNGSPRGIAGVCDPTGKILGMMPHPECSVSRFLFPRWTAGVSYEKYSLRFFENIVRAAEEYV